MAISSNLAFTSLLLLCAAGVYGTWYLLMNNGSTELLSATANRQILPGTNEVLKTSYIGVSATDSQFAILTLFFWQLVDGSHPPASMFCFHFATQVACGWGLLMIEGLRRGHRWKIISFIGTLGILVQNLAYAVIVPLYLVVYLTTTPLLSSKRSAMFLVESQVTKVIPLSLILGYLLPAILMSLPAPSIISFEQKQTFIAIWQMFPVCVAILQAILPYLGSVFLGKQAPSSKRSGTSEIEALRRLYMILMVIAGVGQISTVTLLATSKFFPDLFAPEYQGVFDPGNVFIPAAFTPSTKMPTVGSGAFLLLQYDQLIGSSSMALFASFMYISADKVQMSLKTVTSMAFWCLISLVLTGPLGYAVFCIWTRDELIVQGEEERGKRRQ